MTPAGLAFVTGISGQDGATSQSASSPEGVEVHALANVSSLAIDMPGVGLHPGDLADIDDVRALMLELAPDEVYNLAALSSVAQSWEQPGPDGAAQRSGGGRADGVGLAVPAAVRAAGAVRPGIQRGDLRRARPVTSTRAPRSAPINPYGAAEGVRRLSAHVYRQRGLFVGVILYNKSPAPPASLRDPQDHGGRGRDRTRPGGIVTLGNLDARRDWGWAPDYVDAMVRAARADEATDFVVATA